MTIDISKLIEDKVRKFEETFCQSCPLHREDLCGYIKRELESKCQYLQDVSLGYELALNELMK